MKTGIELFMAFLGSLGFAGIFNVERSRILPAALGGLLAWGVNLALEGSIASEAIRYFLATGCITIYAEIMARAMKTPTTLFIVPAAVPLIPGGSLYRTMSYAVEGEKALFLAQAVYTAELAAAIAVGIIIATGLWTGIYRAIGKKA